MDRKRLNVSVLLTGATGGIGRATAEALARRGAKVLVHGRTAAKVETAVGALGALGAAADGFVADLSSLAETAQLARAVADRVPDLDVLVNNAGVGFGADRGLRERSRDGFELRLAVNYLAPFVLTATLLEAGLPRRAVINVASAGQEALDFDDLMSEHRYEGVRAYRRSKLALVMWTFDLAREHPDRQFHALHPGTFLDTGMVRESGIAPRGPASQGAESIQAVLDAALAGGVSGRYFDEGSPARADAQAYDAAARHRLRAATLATLSRKRV